MVVQYEIRGAPGMDEAAPSPATHAILTVLKAGETVRQTLAVPKRAVFILTE